MKGKLPFEEGDEISYANLKKGIDNLNATQNFSVISYSLEEDHAKDNLVLTVKESTNKTFLKFGLHYDDLFKSGILVNLTQKKTFFKNDITSLDVVLGDNFRYNLDYYIDNGFYWSFGFKSQFNKFNKNVTKEIAGLQLDDANIKSINVDFSDLTNQAYFQTLFAQKFLLGTGVELKLLDIRSETLAGTSPIIDKSDYISVFGYMKYDSFDKKYFPKKGWYFSGDIQSYLFSSNYTKKFNPFSIAKTELGIATTLFKKTTLKVQAEGGLSIGGESVSFFDFVLGGYGYNTIDNIKHFYGYDFLSLAANSYLKSSVTIDYEILKKNHLNFTANYANLENNLFQTLDWLTLPKYSGYAVGYGLETIIGPVEVKYSWSPENAKGYTWFSIGFWF